MISCKKSPALWEKSIWSRINQEYLEDKTIEEKDDDRLKLNEEEMHTEDGNMQQSKFESINFMNRRKEETEGSRVEGKEKYNGKELSMQKGTSEIEKCVTECFQEIEVEISKQCLEEKCANLT